GESNTASNVGAGVGVYKEKSGVDLRFKSLTSGASGTITVTADAGGNEIDFDLAQNGASTGQILKWNGTSWAPVWNSSLSSADGSVLNALTINNVGTITATATHAPAAGDDLADVDFVQ